MIPNQHELTHCFKMLCSDSSGSGQCDGSDMWTTGLGGSWVWGWVHDYLFWEWGNTCHWCGCHWRVHRSQQDGTVVKGVGDGHTILRAHIGVSAGGGHLQGNEIFSRQMSQMILPAGNDDRGLGDMIMSRDGIEASGCIMGEGTPSLWTWVDKEKGRDSVTTWIVPFRIGLAVALRTGDGIGDMRRGRSVSEGGVISVEEGGKGWYREAVDADISQCHSCQERFLSQGPS